MRSCTADYVVDVGPGAGVHGGEIVAQGTPADIMADQNSLTGAYLTGAHAGRGAEKAPQSRTRRASCKLIGARGNNLQQCHGGIPLGLFTCITGVSGGGKSTLIVDTLYKAVARRLNGALEHPAPVRLARRT